jgi:hypothetical protein
MVAVFVLVALFMTSPEYMAQLEKYLKKFSS